MSPHRPPLVLGTAGEVAGAHVPGAGAAGVAGSAGPGAAFTGAALDEVRGLLVECYGLLIEDSRRDVLAQAARARTAARAQPDTESYVGLLRADPAEFQELVELLVVPETYFCRSPPQLRALEQVVLPDLIERARARGQRQLRIWSAGCSSGEEVYTLAMLLARLLPDRGSWDLTVLGTDISQVALTNAKLGCYGARSVAQLGEADLARYFTPHGAQWRVADDLREMAEWRQHNLVSSWAPFAPGSADLIVCRNVTIYFGRDTARRVVDSFHRCLAPDGWLLLGPSETLWRLHDGFHTVRCEDAFVYHRREVPPVVTPSVSLSQLPASGARPPGAIGPGPPVRRPLSRGCPQATRALAQSASKALEVPPPPAVPVTTRRPAVSPLIAPVRRAQERASRTPGVTATRAALSTGAYEAAVTLARTESKRQPLSGEAHYLEGLALVNLGRHEEALPALRKAVYADSGHGFAQFLLAVTLSGRGAAGEAARAYAAAADALDALDPDVSAPELDGRRVSELAGLCRMLGCNPASRRASGGS